MGVVRRRDNVIVAQIIPADRTDHGSVVEDIAPFLPRSVEQLDVDVGVDDVDPCGELMHALDGAQHFSVDLNDLHAGSVAVVYPTLGRYTRHDLEPIDESLQPSGTTFERRLRRRVWRG